MIEVLSRTALAELLASRDPHDITAAADALRRDRHDLVTTVAVVDHLDPTAAHRWSTVTGEAAPEAGFVAQLSGICDLTTDLILLPPSGASLDQLRELWRMLPPRPEVDEHEVLPTAQLGCTDDWVEALRALPDEDARIDALSEFAESGLEVISDGVFPRFHPALGAESAAQWESFWRVAAAAGVEGHAVVLFGPGHDLESVFAQIDAIAALQAETDVFLSVSPCIYDAAGFGGAKDADLTQASFDLRVLAACRLGLPDVPHVSLRYERSDLKNAHTALLCGVDDLVGHLFLGERDAKANTEADDLSVAEMEAWLGEAGFEGFVRNGVYEELSFESILGLEEFDDELDGDSHEEDPA